MVIKEKMKRGHQGKEDQEGSSKEGEEEEIEDKRRKTDTVHSFSLFSSPHITSFHFRSNVLLAAAGGEADKGPVTLSRLYSL